MNLPVKNRIESIDLLKGIVMVLMALDHTRDYFHWSSYMYAPEDPLKSTLPIFFTRWITHFCAPAFSLLAGISAYLVGKRKTTSELSSFLFKRGLWLVIIELTVVNFAWYFDIWFHSPALNVIWALGISMIVLAVLVYLPRQIILIFSLVVIGGHDLLDKIHYKDNYAWAILHDGGFFEYANGYHFSVGYPLIPWIAVMSLGYYFGIFYDSTFDKFKRRKLFNTIGIICIVLFFIVRYINVYGDPFGWEHFDRHSQAIISFFNPNKYPPSLQYLLMTLGGTFIFLANSENLRGKIVNFFSTFGRVPFFYYIIHLYLIHVIAMLFAAFSDFGWRSMILPDWACYVPSLKGFGYPLYVVYIVWLSVIAMLYPLCKKFDAYKMAHKEIWWLSYL